MAEYPCFAEIRYNVKGKGRGLFATKDFQPGDVIVEEIPLVNIQFAWNRYYGYSGCGYCLRSLETAQNMARRLANKEGLFLPFGQCCPTRAHEHDKCDHCDMRFCCVACKEQAMLEFHQVLCPGTDDNHPISQIDDMWRQLHYPPETTNILILARMAAMVIQSDYSDTLLEQFNAFCSDIAKPDEGVTLKLLRIQFEDQVEQLRLAFQKFFTDERVALWFTYEGFRKMLAMIGTNSQGIGSSSVAVWARNVGKLDLPYHEGERARMDVDKVYKLMDKYSANFLNVEGIGLYERQSAANHSCMPNAEVQFPHNNNRLIVVAKELISTGEVSAWYRQWRIVGELDKRGCVVQTMEEILICYLEDCDVNRSRHTRQKILRDYYLFNCNCPRCVVEASQPDETSDEEEEEEEEDDEEEDTDDELWHDMEEMELPQKPQP